MLLQHANDDAGICASDIAQILQDATGINPKRKLWISSVLFAELRPSSFRPGTFSTLDELAFYVRSIATVVSPDPYMMLRAARLRDLKWMRHPNKRTEGEKARCMTLGDAIHIVSALWVRDACRVPDLEFLTFDNSADASVETDPGTKSLPLLSLEEFTYGINDEPDVLDSVRLPRLRPMLGQQSLDLDANSAA